MENVEELISEIHAGLWKWYNFKVNSSILYVKDEKDDIDLNIDSAKVTCISLELIFQTEWLKAHKGEFDYVISASVLEKCISPIDVLQSWKLLLKADGCLILGMNNRFGIRYFCGDRDPYTRRNFDSIENYAQTYANKEDSFNGRMYDRSELENILHGAGFDKFKFFSIFTDLKNPSLIYADDYLPNEDLANRVFPTYNYPDTVFLTEEKLYSSLAANGMFHLMANAYLIECPLSEKFSDVLHVTSSIERGKKDALFTIIHRNATVEKKAIYPEGIERLKELKENIADLKLHDVSVIEGEFSNDRYVMPYLNAEVGQIYLKRIMAENKEKFLQNFDQLRDIILNSSEIVSEGGENGIILKNGYIDLIPLNSFYIDEKFVFYDQEFCIKNCPFNVILARAITTLYVGNEELNKFLPKDELYSRYGLLKDKSKWISMELDFLDKLRKEKELKKYHDETRRKNLTVNANRQRLNFSTEAYQRIFIDIFNNADTRKLILFGSGSYTKRFIELYSMDYEINAILDNNQEKWGKKINNVEIQSPNILKNFNSGEYKIIICIKKYTSVIRQLEDMGIFEYSIFDPNNNYPRKRRPIVAESTDISQSTSKKKYHVGYIAGVFDLFHIGHLNMFKRAKEQCDYLIVGIVTDEGVRKYKEVEPFVPFEERVEMVKSCRYVDEVVKIPVDFGSTIDAWKLHHFDVQFSGSDYVNDANWLANKEFLERHGADLVFFSYTQSTSSTKLKKLINEKLI